VRRLIVTVIGASIALALGAAQVALARRCGSSAMGDPTMRLQTAERQLHQLLQRRYPSWSPEREAQSSRVKEILDDLLDYQEIARRSLAGHWQELSPAQRSQFVTLLKELSAQVFTDRLAGTSGLSGSSFSVRPDGEGKEVQVAVEAPGQTRDGSIYTFVRDGCRWMVCDVDQGGVDLVDEYRHQFDSIIAQDSFDGLIERMRGKLRRNEREGGGD
jgi:phospholipid transport system substrate-binding protein